MQKNTIRTLPSSWAGELSSEKHTSHQCWSVNLYSTPSLHERISALSGTVAQKKETGFSLILRQIFLCALLSIFCEIFSKTKQQLAMAD